MSQGQMMDILRSSMLVVFKLAGPLLIVSILVGLVIAIFQAATQIHEQTLTFVPKLLVLGLVLLLLGPWMISTLSEFMYSLFRLMMVV